MLVLSFFVGLLMNFVGYMPFGNINLTAVRLAITQGMRSVMTFIITFSIVEFFFTFGIMKFVNFFSDSKTFLQVLEYVMVAVFLFMGWYTWVHRHDKHEVKTSSNDSIRLGIILAIVNPMIIPFWVIAGAYVIKQEWIVNNTLGLTIFSLGSSCGAFLALYLYARFAGFIQRRFALSSTILNKVVAILFLGLAGYGLIKIGLDFYKHHRKAAITAVI